MRRFALLIVGVFIISLLGCGAGEKVSKPAPIKDVTQQQSIPKPVETPAPSTSEVSKVQALKKLAFCNVCAEGMGASTDMTTRMADDFSLACIYGKRYAQLAKDVEIASAGLTGDFIKLKKLVIAAFDNMEKGCGLLCSGKSDAALEYFNKSLRYMKQANALVDKVRKGL